VTLGFTLGDVATWLFVFWLCLDWFFTINSHLGGIMDKILKTTLKTGLDTLAALRGHGNDRVPRQTTY
jgi:energy-converting hydrogenase Eha subunit F